MKKAPRKVYVVDNGFHVEGAMLHFRARKK